MNLVAGVDSSTQSCKVMIRDADSGDLVRAGIARHRAGTEISATVWMDAFNAAVRQAGGLEDVKALSVAGQQHGMVTVDERGDLVRDAMLWNDTKSAGAAEDLIEELGGGDCAAGKRAWADAIGSVPVASLTVTKLRWLADNEPDHASRVAAVALPHDWLSWKICGSTDITDLFTDRSEASGTGYYDSSSNKYRRDLTDLAMRCDTSGLVLPAVKDPAARAGSGVLDGNEFMVGPGCGDNAGAALGLGLKEGEVAVSVGTSGVVSLVTRKPTHDSTGLVAGFADAAGGFLPLACTLNASRVLDAYATALNVGHDDFSALALSAPPGAEGLVCVPYLEGERTPNLPTATGSLLGVTVSNLTPENIARAAVEGVLCGLNAGIDAVRALGVAVTSIILVGGGARSEALCRIAPTVLGLPVRVPEPGEYVADGAARQAAWVLSGQTNPPVWRPRLVSEFDGTHEPFITERFNEVNSLHIGRNRK
ncbi:xylulokinase [Corynebacterium mendelii]|uniref:Xylulose kinase n=1 Tax=Corynebacterium mendelii TaxID=2765362 RepID=A0A939IZ33_9CORY|nr:xylulose kinase [Corynebacterium mendelii]